MSNEHTERPTRTPPYSEEAERGSLGAMMLDPFRVVPLAVNTMKITPEMFYVQYHVTLCHVIFDMVASGRVVDLLTLSERLRDLNRLDEIGGSSYLERIVDSTPTAAHAEYYLDIVRQKHIVRRVVCESRQIIESAYGADRGDELIKRASHSFSSIIDEIVEERSNAQELERSLAEWQENHAAYLEKRPITIPGLPFPYDDLNQITGGMEPSLIIVAARPSQGKTTIEDCISVNSASHGYAVARCTLDMSRRRLLQRAVCRIAGVSLPKLKFGYAGESNFERVRQAMALIKTYPMFINENDRTIEGICTWARAQKIKNDIRLLTVDHATLVGVSKAGKGWDLNRTVGYVSAQLKALALELKIPVILLSQLSRAVEKDSKKPRPPRLSDLRDSGSLEQDANIVIFLYKDSDSPELRNKKGKVWKRPVWVDVQKNQDGETGALEFWLNPNYFRFERANPDFMLPESEDTNDE